MLLTVFHYRNMINKLYYSNTTLNQVSSCFPLSWQTRLQGGLLLYTIHSPTTLFLIQDDVIAHAKGNIQSISSLQAFFTIFQLNNVFFVIFKLFLSGIKYWHHINHYAKYHKIHKYRNAKAVNCYVFLFKQQIYWWSN